MLHKFDFFFASRCQESNEWSPVWGGCEEFDERGFLTEKEENVNPPIDLLCFQRLL